MTMRRDFLQHSAILTGGVLLGGSCTSSSGKKTCGIQLYSMRDYVAKDLKSTLEKTAAAGYTDIETFGWEPGNVFFGKSPKEFASLIQNAGLQTTSGHYLPEGYLFNNGSSDEWKQVVETAVTLKQQYTVIPWIPDQYRSEETFKFLTDKLSEAAEISHAAGLKLAYHNHDFEFAAMGDSFPLEYMIRQTDADKVHFELDIYWAVAAQKDPIALFQQFPGRFKLWHVKDMDKNKPSKNTEVGSGSIDYKAIFKHASTAGMERFFVEQENFEMDGFESIKKSYEYVTGIA